MEIYNNKFLGFSYRHSGLKSFADSLIQMLFFYFILGNNSFSYATFGLSLREL